MRRRLAFRPSAAVEVIRSVWTHPANHGDRLRAVVRTLAFQTRARLLGRATIVPFGRASRIVARLDDCGSKRAAYAPIPDWSEMQVWFRHLQAGDLFIDVGANVGLYSVLAAEAGCRVVAVEPLPAACDQLRENLALNGFRATVVEAALAHRSGTRTLRGPDSLRQHLADEGEDGLEVSVQTLDSILEGRLAAGVKIDVEGAERMVLEGATDALRSERIGLLQLEWNEMSEHNYGESRSAVTDLLTAFGYGLFRPDSEGVLRPVEDLTPGPDLFARPGVYS